MITQKERLGLHRAIQKNIADQIGHGKVMIEHSFPHHFADIYWPAKSLVFEIQCSPINIFEALKRNSDYEQLGVDVVWILHQKCFNRRTLSAAEQYLRSRNAYYTNIFTNGTGAIYDQHEVLDGHLRLYKSTPYVIDITKPKLNPVFQTYKKRLEIDALWNIGKSSYRFDGDRNYIPFQERLRFSQIKSLLKPLYKNFKHSDSSLMKLIYLALRSIHFLRHLWKIDGNNFLKRKNKSGWQRQRKGASFH